MSSVVLVLLVLPILVALAPLPGLFAMRRSRLDGAEFASLAVLRAAGQVDTIILDRWGTVTTGDLVVSEIEPLDKENERTLKWFAAALEHADVGPVADAIARLSSPGKLTAVETFPGRGIGGAVDRHPVRVGVPSWLGMEERGGLGVTVAVEVDHRPFGYLTVVDQTRPGARLAIARLKGGGIEPVLLSDAPPHDTEHLAQECGIDKWLVGATTVEREQLVREQRSQDHHVAVVARADGNGEMLAVADLPITDLGGDDGGTPGLRLADLDVERVATALELARRLPGVVRRTRFAGLAVAAIGGVVAIVTDLGVAAVLGCAVLGALGVAVVALVSWGRPPRPVD